MVNTTIELVRFGVTKYKIAKRVGCAYNTVMAWEREHWKPGKKYQDRLDKYLGEVKEGK